MPSIVITEKDNTTPGGFAESNEVVYIPGFVNLDDANLYKEVDNEDGTKSRKYIGLEYHKPHLFTSTRDFKALCGSNPVTFSKDQLYSDLVDGFSSDAIPADGIMFRKDDPDPAYLMAMELLNSGMNVLYERINNFSSATEVDKDDPSIDKTAMDWFKSYNFINYNDGYENINITTAPDAFKSVVGTKDAKITSASFTNFYLVDAYGKKQHYADKDSFVSALKVAVGNELNTVGDFDTCCVQKLTTGTGLIQAKDGETTVECNVVVTDPDILFVWTGEGTYFEDSNGTNLTAMPEDWYTNYRKYYQKKTTVTSGVLLTEAPEDDSYTHVAPIVLTADIVDVYTNELSEVFTDNGGIKLTDRGNYNIKYLTSGGYPVYEYDGNSLVNKMLTLCKNRGDCYAIIEHSDNEDRTQNISLPDSLYGTVKNDTTFNTNGEYGAMFTPWAEYNIATATTTSRVRMPAGFAYLMSLADSVKTNAPWLAIAGAARGLVRNLSQNGMTTVIPNGIADSMQPRDEGVAVNALTNIRPYGYMIWGNRTLKPSEGDLVAHSFLNVRNLVCDVKKVCYSVARSLTFEQNNDVLWVNFKAGIAPTLDRMVSGYGISGYKIVRDTERAEASAKATVCARIYLYPVYPVEDFYIDIILSDDEITVE